MRQAILTCARKLAEVSLIQAYRTEPKIKKGKEKGVKLKKAKTDMLRRNGNCLESVESLKTGKTDLRWFGSKLAKQDAPTSE